MGLVQLLPPSERRGDRPHGGLGLTGEPLIPTSYGTAPGRSRSANKAAVPLVLHMPCCCSPESDRAWLFVAASCMDSCVAWCFSARAACRCPGTASSVAAKLSSVLTVRGLRSPKISSTMLQAVLWLSTARSNNKRGSGFACGFCSLDAAALRSWSGELHGGPGLLVPAPASMRIGLLV